MEVNGHNLHTPKLPAKKPQRHSLQPQIFLQLEFSSPTGKTIDASRIGVLNQGWQDAPHAPNVCENYLTHVRVEHCATHSSDPAPYISSTNGSTFEHHDTLNLVLVGSDSEYGESKTDAEEKSPDFPESEIGSEENTPLSPSSGLPSKVLGRHDHLLEPLPNELFEVLSSPLAVGSEHDSTKSHKKVTSVVTALIGSDIVDVRDCNLELFDVIDCPVPTKDVDAQATPRRNSRKGKHPRRRHSSSAIEIPELCTDESLTPKRDRKKGVGTERVRSRSSTNARRRHSAGRNRQELNTSSSHRRSSKGSPNQYHRRRSEGSKDIGEGSNHIETSNPSRPSSRKSISKDESEGKPSSHRARRKNQSREADECTSMDVSRRKSAAI